MTETKRLHITPGKQELQPPPTPLSECTPVSAWSEPVVISTYMPATPDRNPMFLETRVYQGSSGAVYPLPFIDRIATEPKPHTWQAIHLENEWLRLMILPEIGGRIHIGFDKVNGYDFFYRQNVIKPALVGLAGPWISGGVEFNWPQHHRPATFLPVAVDIERSSDGSVTVWCSDHDPLTRMKGMHGVCLYPDRAYVELKVRLYNRTQTTQTFLWWANMATRVHEHYQSFFPPDVRFVADHAKRAITTFPHSDRDYYGVRYAERAESGVPDDEMPAQFRPDGSYAPNDLSWYANIPTPTSYMIVGSREDFFGGYDHARQAGVVHVANHHIAPGKKQWTWGNHEFGYTWDRNLTDNDGPYIELMAGVYTDNQPDFSFLAPGETKAFSQFWYPIRSIGVPQAANLYAALSLAQARPGFARIGTAVTRDIPASVLTVKVRGKILERWCGDLSLRDPLLLEVAIPSRESLDAFEIELRDSSGCILRYAPAETVPAGEPQVATEPPPPHEIDSIDRLYLTGIHLEQYRHATRSPQPYWAEALRRDPGDSRSHNALGQWHLKRGELALAEQHFRSAIERLTERNPNPANSEAFYYLGLTLRYLEQTEDAYAAFYKATWAAAQRAPAFHALAEVDASAQRWGSALDHVQRSLRADADNNNARNLAVIVLKKLNRYQEAEAILSETREMDPLDLWARYLDSGETPADPQQCIDLALDLQRAGLKEEALEVLRTLDLTRHDGSAPIAAYQLAFLYETTGDHSSALRSLQQAAQLPADYVFPHRIEEMLLLENVCLRCPTDPRAPYYLGNLLYDRRRYDEAIARWETAAALDPSFPTVWRNLGLACFNIRANPESALIAYDKAIAAEPSDARVLYERDQLWKRIGETPANRLAELNRHRDLLASRDDLAVEHATLLNQTGDPSTALQLLTARHFQPWEGGEGLVLAQYVRASLLAGKQLLRSGRSQSASRCFQATLHPPRNLSEAWHLLANTSDIYFWIGKAERAAGNESAARAAFDRAARQRGDFKQMSVRRLSDMSYWSAMAMRQLGEEDQATALFGSILAYSQELDREEPKIDYFATSLPAMLLFRNDMKRRQHIEALFLRAQGNLGFGNVVESESLLKEILALDGNHSGAADLLEDMHSDQHSAGGY
jgi:tetratricopeptide (TPR) repeat protein